MSEALARIDRPGLTGLRVLMRSTGNTAASRGHSLSITANLLIASLLLGSRAAHCRCDSRVSQQDTGGLQTGRSSGEARSCQGADDNTASDQACICTTRVASTGTAMCNPEAVGLSGWHANLASR